MITNKSEQKFIKNGYIECINLFNRQKCKNISNKLKKSFNLKEIFLSQSDFLNIKKKPKKKLLIDI